MPTRTEFLEERQFSTLNIRSPTGRNISVQVRIARDGDTVGKVMAQVQQLLGLAMDRQVHPPPDFFLNGSTYLPTIFSGST